LVAQVLLCIQFATLQLRHARYRKNCITMHCGLVTSEINGKLLSDNLGRDSTVRPLEDGADGTIWK
jgi:hypothetical protein